MHGERFEYIALLWHPANASRRTLVRGQAMQRHAVQMDTSAVLLRSAHQGVHQGRLAGAIAPQQGQRVALRQL